MNWADVASVVAKGAPLLGSILGGPAGAGVGALVASALGTDPTPDAVSAALLIDPDAALKLRTLETTHQIEMQRLYLDGERAALADRADARARDVAMAATGKQNHRADYMVGGAVLGLLSCLISLVFFREKITGEAVGIISTVAGLFGACLRDAFAYEFGSSRSSAQKDVTIARLTQ